MARYPPLWRYLSVRWMRTGSLWRLRSHWGGEKRELKGILYVAETSRELVPVMFEALLGFCVFTSCEPAENTS